MITNLAAKRPFVRDNSPRDFIPLNTLQTLFATMLRNRLRGRPPRPNGAEYACFLVQMQKKHSQNSFATLPIQR